MHLRAFESGSTFFSFYHRLHIPSLSIIFNVSTAWKRMLISRSASNTRFCTYFTFSRAWNKFHESPRLELVSLTRALRFHVFLRQESSFPMLEFVFTFPLFHSGWTLFRVWHHLHSFPRLGQVSRPLHLRDLFQHKALVSPLSGQFWWREISLT